jgi:uncharacterized 2Fe-2S/4Fe-4S cluster protein (DUF4445 family)
VATISWNWPEGLAVAVDLGTTTLAASLVETVDGRRLAALSRSNPQRLLGADILSRLAAADDPARRQELSSLLRQGLREMIEELLTLTSQHWGAIRGAAVAGNPAMEHFLRGLPLASLARPPFRPLFREGCIISGTDIGWPISAPTYLCPLPSGFVGGDLVAFLHGQHVKSIDHPATGPVLYLDLGTNGELALETPAGLFATSTAAGPAFEGGNLSCGMPAGPGAICRCSLEGSRLVCFTVDGGPARGVCGSGVVHAVSLLLSAGVIDATGRLLPPHLVSSNLATRLAEIDGEQVFVLHRDAFATVFLGQADIRAFQLAVAALRAGILMLCKRAGIRYDEVSHAVLTGSFGAELDPVALKSVGVLSEKMLHHTRFVREGVLAGVERLLFSPHGPAEVESLAASLQVVPLSGNPAFEQYFLDSMNFPT